MQKCRVVDVDEENDTLDDKEGGSEDDEENETEEITVQAQKLRHLHAFDRMNYHDAVDGGGWEGWHCEGSLVRYLFGLLMWEVFFMPITTSSTVFLTPYQDGPIDFPYPSFFHNR